MENVILKGYKITKYEFVNQMPQGSNMKMKAKYNYHVKYTPNHTCCAELDVEMTDDAHAADFFVRTTILGFFDVDGSAEKEKLHIATFHTLFPVLRTIVSVMTSAAGVPPVLIPQIRIENQDIYRFEMNPGANGR